MVISKLRLAVAAALMLGGAAATSDAVAQFREDGYGLENVRVTDIAPLAGQTIEGRAGQPIGRLDYLVIDPETGEVVFALIGSGLAGDRVVPLRWEEIDHSRWFGENVGGRLRVDETAETLARRPTYTVREAIRLTAGGARAALFEKHEMAPPGFSAGTPPSRPRGAPYILSGAGEHSLVPPPSFELGERLVDTPVIDGGTGDEIGRIATLVIDLDAGVIAYALLDRARRRGSAGSWVPIPLQVLEWLPGGKLRLSDDASDELDRMATLPRSWFPSTVLRMHLRQLYRNYDIAPYWKAR